MSQSRAQRLNDTPDAFGTNPVPAQLRERFERDQFPEDVMFRWGDKAMALPCGEDRA